FSEPPGTAARRGVVAALAAQYEEGDRLFVRGDVGVSRSLAASGEIRYLSPRNRFRALLSIKPDGFPTLGLSDMRGERLELDWSNRATDRLSVTAYGTYDHFNLAGSPQTIGTSRIGLSYELTKRLSFITGADASAVRTPATSIDTVGLPLGLTWEAAGYGLAASYRLLEHSGTARRGDTLRLSAHAGRGRFSANAWAERQRQAPTLDIIFSAQPGLELALLRLGISVRNPEDVARALRDNAALIDLGFITGVNVDLTPRRVQAGLNFGWVGSGSRSNHFRFFAVGSRDEGIRTTRENMLATLTYSRRIFTATDVFASYSWYSTTVGTQEHSDTSVDMGIRQQFNGIPSFLRRPGTIDGFAFLDPEMRGKIGESTEPLSDIAITLDGARTVRTDAMGAYAFYKVPPGAHRLVAQLPAAPRAFFTTPSQVDATAPGRIDFGMVWTAARIDGRVVSDAGDGISGVVLSVSTPDGTPNSTSTDSEGRFVFAVPPGTFRVVLATMSLPPGYSIAGTHEQDVAVAPDDPQSISFEVQAIRSIAGRAPGAAEVTIEALGRSARVDESGNFVFRSMPSGTFTLTAVTGGETVSSSVTLPPEPFTSRDVLLADPMVTVAIPAKAPVARGFRVAAGVFRNPANAAEARRRIEAAGGRAEISRAGSLHLVTVGPFESREGARREAARLQSAGVETVVIGDRAGSRPYVVQAGVFRQRRNLLELVSRLAQKGETSFTVRNGALTFVYVGPFPTRQQAADAGKRLESAGFESYVTRR
ncbi:MAG: SPOR domain-containing protein, partial [Thermoanaerobaculia bacterium]